MLAYNYEDIGTYNEFNVPMIWIRCKDVYELKAIWFRLFNYLRENDLRNKVIANEIYIFPKK